MTQRKETDVARRLRRKLTNLNSSMEKARSAGYEIELSIGRCNPDGDLFGFRIRTPENRENGKNKPLKLSSKDAAENLQRMVKALNKEIKLAQVQEHLGLDIKLGVGEDYGDQNIRLYITNSIIDDDGSVLE